LLGGMIVAEFLGVCHYFDFIVMEEGDKKWKNMVSGTDSIH
jgi:predicted secreted protein